MSLPNLPAGLEASFREPGVAYCPLQIVHHPQWLAKFGQGWQAGMPEPAPTPENLRAGLIALRKAGLGGLVTNVSFANYMRDEPSWQAFLETVRIAHQLGLRVWIYDEDGYPSGAAGGLVLQDHPELEAQELILDGNREGSHQIRPAFEGTHAAHNFYAIRRHANLLDERATERFIALTHEAYARRLGAELDGRVEAFFTDEPSSMAFHIGLLPEPSRGKIRVQDAPDPKIERRPSVPWVADLPIQYRQRYGEDLLARLPELFGGEDERARQTRRRYWSLVADLAADRYFGRLERWCAAHRVASSGHALAEENLAMHPPVDGNTLRALQRMHIPGIDILSSNPALAARSGAYCLTGALAASAATLNGTRRVMSETSDHSERMAGKPISLEWMLACAAYQYAFGVTEFTLYYSPQTLGAWYPAYCAGVGRLGALLREARRLAPLALYYPIRDVWTHYRPTEHPLTVETQPQRLQTIVQSFTAAIKHLHRAGTPCCLVDHEHLAQARVEGGQLRIGQASFDTFACSDVDELPAEAQQVLGRFEAAGGRMLALRSAEDRAPERLRAFSPFPVAWHGFGGIVGAFQRENLLLALLVNTSAEPLSGTCLCTFPQGGVRWDIVSGTATPLPPSQTPPSFTLEPYQAVVLSRPG